jgi:hypothetical protein
MDVDNMLNKMLGKKSKKVQFDNRATWNKPAVNIPITGNFWQAQPNTKFAPTQIQNKILPIQRTNAGPAPIRNQSIWKNMPVQNKITNRMIMKDNDRDAVPNKYDCQPNNPVRDEVKGVPRGWTKDNLKTFNKTDYNGEVIESISSPTKDYEVDDLETQDSVMIIRTKNGKFRVSTTYDNEDEEVFDKTIGVYSSYSEAKKRARDEMRRLSD